MSNPITPTGAFFPAPIKTPMYMNEEALKKGELSRPWVMWFQLTSGQALAQNGITMVASPASIQLGQSTTLYWASQGASSVSIDQGIGSVALSGSQVVSPTVSTTYTATATNGDGTAIAIARVNVITTMCVPLSIVTGAVDSDATLVNTSPPSIFRVPLAEDFTLNNPTDAICGQKLIWCFVNTDSSDHTITLDTKFNRLQIVPGNGFYITASGSLAITANTTAYLCAIYDAATDTFNIVGFFFNGTYTPPLSTVHKVTVYATPGDTGTWTKDAAAKFIEVIMVGGGGGGGGGASNKASGVIRMGGSGGGGGARHCAFGPADSFGATESYQVGQGGGGGAAGGVGNAGTPSAFGPWAAYGGGAGYGDAGTDFRSGGGGGGLASVGQNGNHNVTALGGYPRSDVYNSRNTIGGQGGGSVNLNPGGCAEFGGGGGGVSNSASMTNYNGGSSLYGAGAGGSGGSINASNVTRGPGEGGTTHAYTDGGGGAAGASGATGTPGSDGTPGTGDQGGEGGGGGGASTGADTAGADGGNGGDLGGGGGGGGAATGAASGGAGGDGGDGIIIVIEHL